MTGINDEVLETLERLLYMIKGHIQLANKWGEEGNLPALYARHSAIESAISEIRIKDLQ
jgi:hypothetical protein